MGLRISPGLSPQRGHAHSRIRVLTSNDAKSWQTATTLSDPRGDIRDAKMAAMPDGRLMLLTATQLFETGEHNHQSIVWLTKDLKTWDGPFDVGDPDMWLWGIVWHKGVGYSVAYSTMKTHFVRVYKTTDGQKFEPLGEKFDLKVPLATESAMAFEADDTAHILIRCDPDPSFLATASPPYADWTVKQSDTRVGGQAMTLTSDGRLLGVGRLYEAKQRTSLSGSIRSQRKSRNVWHYPPAETAAIRDLSGRMACSTSATTPAMKGRRASILRVCKFPPL